MTNIFMKQDDSKNMKSIILINQILKIYDDSLDFEEVDDKKLNHKYLKCSPNRFMAVMNMLQDGGYITGIDYKEWNDGSFEFDVSDSSITLAGLQYYAENTKLLSKLGIIVESAAIVAANVTGIIKI